MEIDKIYSYTTQMSYSQFLFLFILSFLVGFISSVKQLFIYHIVIY